MTDRTAEPPIDINGLPGMKEDELIALGPCAICGQPQLAHKDFTFYVIDVQRAGFMAAAIKRRVGLEMQVGSSHIAAILGPNEDLAKIIDGPRRVFIAESCAQERMPHPIELLRKPENRKG